MSSPPSSSPNKGGKIRGGGKTKQTRLTILQKPKISVNIGLLHLAGNVVGTTKLCDTYRSPNVVSVPLVLWVKPSGLGSDQAILLASVEGGPKVSNASPSRVKGK